MVPLFGLFYIFSQLCSFCSAYVDVTSGYQVFFNLPTNMTNNQICWLFQASYYDIDSDKSGRTLRTGRFEPGDQQSLIYRDTLVELEAITESYEYSNLDLSTYNGPEPYNSETDYCTDIMDLVMRVYDEEGHYVHPTTEDYPATASATVQRRDSDADMEECIDEPCYDVRDCQILNSKCGHCSNSGGREQRYCDWQYTYFVHSFVLHCWYTWQHTCS
ncbi:secreted protein CSS3 [Saccharomyces cerevisiae]|nr:secreted protein CSS3 [Saccharomyces cerevisiae]